MTTFNSLPHDILPEIASNLDYRSLASFSVSCSDAKITRKMAKRRLFRHEFIKYAKIYKSLLTGIDLFGTMPAFNNDERIDMFKQTIPAPILNTNPTEYWTKTCWAIYHTMNSLCVNFISPEYENAIDMIGNIYCPEIFWLHRDNPRDPVILFKLFNSAPKDELEFL